MSFLGIAKLFSTLPVLLTDDLVLGLLKSTEATRILRGSKHPSTHDWQDFLNEIETDPPYEPLKGDLSPEQLAALCEPGMLVRLSIVTPLGTRIWEEIQEHIPEEVRGEASLSNVSMALGEHDVYECLEHEEGKYFGRATVSVSIDGPLCPHDWPEFRRLATQLPTMRELERRLTAVLGPIRCEVYWL